jgi:hypothetical protein
MVMRMVVVMMVMMVMMMMMIMMVMMMMMMMCGLIGPLPYVVFGPPGTGKTRTLVEAVRHILRWKPVSRLLLTAPSNAAADIFIERLQYAFARKKKSRKKKKIRW